MNEYRLFILLMASAAGGTALAQSAVGKEQALRPELAASLTKFGLDAIVGSGELISKNGKSSVNVADAAVLGSDLTGLIDKYKSITTEANLAGSLTKLGGEAVITTAETLGLSSGIGAIPTAATAAAARYGNEKFANYISNDGAERARAFLGQGLSLMSRSDRKAFDTQVRDGKYEEAAKVFETRTQKLAAVEMMLKDDPQAAAAVNRLLVETMQATSSESLIAAGKAYKGTQAIESDLANHTRSMQQFARNIKDRLSTLEKSSQNLATDIGKVRTELGNLREDQKATAFQLGLVQDILFDEQTPTAKLALLNAGAKPGLTAEQKRVLTDYLKIEVKKQRILENSWAVVRSVSDVNTIMTNFGIKDSRISDAVRYGTIGSNALGQAFQGNYLGAIAAVSGLFSASQPDPTQASFNRIFAELAEIQSKLDNVVRLQRQTLDSILALSQQLAQTEKRLHERLDNIDFEVKRLAVSSIVQLWAGFRTCMVAWDKRADPRYQYDDTSLKFATVRGQLEFTADWSSDVFRCASTLRGTFSQLRNAGVFGNPLRLEFAIGALPDAPPPEIDRTFSKGDLQSYLESVHRPAVTIVNNQWAARAAKSPAWGSVAGALALMSSPAVNAIELQNRVRKLDSGKLEEKLTACGERSLLGIRLKTFLCADSATFDSKLHGGNDSRANARAVSFLKDAIVREQVGHIARWAALTAGSADFARIGTRENSSISLEKLAASTSKSSVSYGQDIIFSALTVSDIAIAQQVMVYGDITAQFVFELLWDKDKSGFRDASSEDQKLAMKLLANSNNPWLQHNVALLILMASDRKCPNSACSASELPYRVLIETFAFEPAQGLDPKGATREGLEPATPNRMESLRSIFLLLFSLPSELELEAVDSTISTPVRRLYLKLSGLKLPLPTPDAWAEKRLLYPSSLEDRLLERQLLAQKWADYVALDGLAPEAKLRLVRAISNGPAK